jgi:8-oxo-dGTP pyrophosphatase MutT (NUDIX family)
MNQSGPTVRQVAVVAIRRADGGVEVCLIRRKGSEMWAIPKGFVDRGDTPERAALNEALEEAGITGKLLDGAVGTYEYEKWSAPLTAAVYVMEVLEEQAKWKEMTFRERSWRPLEEAAVLLATHPVLPLWDRVMERISLHVRNG